MAWGTLLDVVTSGGSGSRQARRASKLLRKGTSAQATVIGMRQYVPKFRINQSDHEHHRDPQMQVALHVHEPSFVAGFEIRAINFEDLRLGDVVPVRHDGERAVPALSLLRVISGDDYPAFCDPPEQGLVDETLWNHIALQRRANAQPAWITFIEADVVRTSGINFARNGQIGALDVAVRARLQGEGFDYETELVRLERRRYASHLEELNLPLPGWARPGAKRTPFVVDWASAASRDPGVGRPAGYLHQLLAERSNSFLKIDGADVTDQSWTPDGAIADAAAHDAVNGIDFETWATIVANCEFDKIRFADQDAYAQQYGVPAGSWPAMNSEWAGRMMRDPRLNIAMAQIRKNVKQARRSR